jgi:hypothetical protein
MGTRPERVLQQTAHFVYGNPCECGRSYIGETGKLLALRLRERRHDPKEGGLG